LHGARPLTGAPEQAGTPKAWAQKAPAQSGQVGQAGQAAGCAHPVVATGRAGAAQSGRGAWVVSRGTWRGPAGCRGARSPPGSRGCWAAFGRWPGWHPRIMPSLRKDPHALS
jgi:hypothetical protein